MVRIILLLLLFLINSCEEKKYSSNVERSNDCENWSNTCSSVYEMEASLEDAWSRKDRKKLLILIGSMYDSLLTDEQFLDRFILLYHKLGLLPIGRYEICDSCWIKTASKKTTERYKFTIVEVYRQYIEFDQYYNQDTIFKYSNFVNRKFNVELDSGIFTADQYLDTLEYFIKNKIEVDVGG